MKASEVKTHLYALLKAGQPLEIEYPKGQDFLLIPKAQVEAMEKKLLAYEAKAAVEGGETEYDEAQVQAMLKEVLGG
ncbi:MAG: hypothetical protein RRB13_16345 [bacterium]|nr:hypothetical protein [bacterium]